MDTSKQRVLVIFKDEIGNLVYVWNPSTPEMLNAKTLGFDIESTETLWLH